MKPELFEKLIAYCAPHPVFNLEWSAYDVLDFANTFLPQVKKHKTKGLWLFDGAHIFEDKEDPVMLDYMLRNSSDLVILFCYTYPKGALIGENKHRVRVEDHEFCVFIETDIDGNLDIYYKPGKIAIETFKSIMGESFVQQFANFKPIKTTVFQLRNEIYKSEYLAENLL